jgi:seryl-tRNA synthetase
METEQQHQHQRQHFERNKRYEGRMFGIILDPDILQETDVLREDLSRSKYVNRALKDFNKREAERRRLVAEIQQELDRVEKKVNAINKIVTTTMQDFSKVSRPESPADSGSNNVVPSIPQDNSPQSPHNATTTTTTMASGERDNKKE